MSNISQVGWTNLIGFVKILDMNVSLFLQKIAQLDSAKLKEIKGIGDVLISNLEEFAHSKRYQKLLTKFSELESNGVSILICPTDKSSRLNLPLSSEIICITGTFDISRNEIKSKLEKRGAKVVDSISSSTTILLAGEKAGSKLDKAKKNSIKILTDYSSLLS
jgi:DNA ligase (NAD+)